MIKRSFIIFFLLLVTACATKEKKDDHSPTEEQIASLDERASLFYKYMRWEMFDEASQMVDPKERIGFLDEFTSLKDVIDITTITLVDVEPVSKDQVDMVTRVEWYRRPEQVIQKSLYTEHWKLINGQWFLESRELVSHPNHST